MTTLNNGVLFVLAFVLVLSVGCGSEPEPEPDYVEVTPALYFGSGNECGVLTDDDHTDGAMTTFIGGQPPALSVCAREAAGEWTMVDGTLEVENITGTGRILYRPSGGQGWFRNASMFQDAPAAMEEIAIGYVRLTATYAGLSGSAVLEIVPEP